MSVVLVYYSSLCVAGKSPPPRFYSFCVVSLIKVAVWKGATINGNGWILAAYVAEFLSEQSPIFEGMAIKFADNKRQYVKGI